MAVVPTCTATQCLLGSHACCAFTQMLWSYEACCITLYVYSLLDYVVWRQMHPIALHHNLVLVIRNIYNF